MWGANEVLELWDGGGLAWVQMLSGKEELSNLLLYVKLSLGSGLPQPTLTIKWDEEVWLPQNITVGQEVFTIFHAPLH